MRSLSHFRVLLLLSGPTLLAPPPLFAQARALEADLTAALASRQDRERSEAPRPPAPPLAWEGAVLQGRDRVERPPVFTFLGAPGAPTTAGAPPGTAIILPLPAGLSLVSLPVRVASEKLSDIFPSLPEGSRAFTWRASDQTFVEGWDQDLPLGRALWLYVPVPVLVAVRGRPNLLNDVSVDLEPGWNLIGVPYGSGLLRARQHVYVNWVRKGFNDAVKAEDLGSSVLSFDGSEYDTVAPDGSFEPLHGYWVYATRAELLELAKPGFDVAFEFPWAEILKEAGTTILTDMGYGDSAKLDQILGKLDDISATQTALDAKLDSILAALEQSKVEILQEIGDTTYVAPVQVALLSHYDKENPGTSLAWFVAQAKAGTGPSVTMATKSDFAKKVLGDWAFIDHFNRIYAGILPAAASDKGLLDNYAELVALESGEYDLKQNYLAMEAYFGTLIGLQVKCATLIMASYDQLAHDPDSKSGYTNDTAATWKKNVFEPAIREETERFLHAVESLAVAKLPVPQQWSDPPVRLPDNVQVVMGLADLYILETLRGIYPSLYPPGIRVRIILNPGASSDPPLVAWVPASGWHLPQVVAPPPFDTWRDYPGPRDYDDWSLPRDTHTRAFRVSRDWRMTQVILPVTSQGAVNLVVMGTSSWWNTDDALATVSAAQTETGTLFGSVTLARRPSTRDVFDPCVGWPITTDVTNYCWSFLGLSDCDRGSVDSCNRRSFHPADKRSTLTMTYEFTYQGATPKAGTWKANADGAVTDNTYCVWSRSYWELFKGRDLSTQVDSTVIEYPYTVKTQTVSVTWQPGQTYVFRVRVQLGVNDAYESCMYYWTYKGAQMTFP